MAESLKNKTVKGVGWSAADNVLNQGVTFLVGLVLARLLSPEEYGLIGIITIFISVFNAIVDSGFSNALIREKNATNEDYNTVFFTNLIVSVFLSLILFFSAPLIANFFSQHMLVSLTKVMSVIIVINALAIIQRTIFIKQINFKAQTKISAISSLSSAAVGIYMAYAGFGVWSLVGQQISRQFINTLFLWIFSPWRPCLQYSKKSFRKLFGFGWKLLLAGLIDTIWREMYQVVIGKFYNARTLGLFSRAQQFSLIFSSNITSVVQRVSYPVLSEIQDDNDKLKFAYKKIIKTTMLFTFTCMLSLAGCAKPIIILLIGEKWAQCIPYLQIICFQMILYPLHALNLNMLQVKGRSDIFLKLEIVKKVIACIPIVLGVLVSIEIMLIGSVIVGMISYYLNAYYSKDLIGYGVKEQVRDILPSFFIAFGVFIIMIAESFIVDNIYILLLLQLSTGFLFFFIANEVLKNEEYLDSKILLLGILRKLHHK